MGHSSLCCNQAFNNCRKTPTGPDPGTFETVCLPQLV